MPRARFERLAFAGLTALGALIIIALPVIPGHDVPQHLAYIRLLAAWQADPTGLPDAYETPDVTNVYATSYRALAVIARLTTPEASLRIALVAYVVLLSLAIRALVRATWRQAGDESGPPMTSALAPLAAFNPVLCMGLLAYVLALPSLLGAIAAAIAYAGSGRRRWLPLAGALAALTAALHGVASAGLLFFSALLVLMRRDRRSLAVFGATLAGVLLAGRVLGSVVKLPAGFMDSLVRNMRDYGAVPGFLGTFRVSFTHWLEKLEQVLASVLGPFPRAEKALSALLVLSVIALVVRERRRTPSRRTDSAFNVVAGVRPAMAVFGVIALLAPAAVQVPDDLSLIDFRLITTATLLGVAAIPPGLLSIRRAPRFGLVAAAAAVLLLWLRQLAGTAGEVMETVRLTDRLHASDRLLALPMHDASAYLDSRNAVLHYAAVHHTARSAGITSLFWGRFSPRLPVGYRPGREPAHPFDWAPWELKSEHLAAFSHVLVRWPDRRDDARLQELAVRVTELRDQGVLETIACDGHCCLFAIADQKLAR